MKKFVVISFALLLIAGPLQAQQKLQLKSSEKGLWLEHKVAAREGLYSIARVYNVPPKELAAYNGLDITKGLNIGQLLRVPLTAANFSQQAPTETPVYYKVGEKEGLYRVSINSGKLPIETIKKWNSLTSDNVSVGSQLIVGYLVSQGMLPAVEEVQPGTQAKVVDEGAPPPVKEPVKIVSPPSPPVKEEPKEVVEIKEIKPEPVKEQKPPVMAQPVMTVPAGNGYFKDQFAKQSSSSKELTVTAGVFKTSSGWQDAKYYLLIDGISPGTILRISNPSTNKTVFAKVLGSMQDVNPGKGGPDIRISNAAAAALEIAEPDKFVVKLNY